VDGRSRLVPACRDKRADTAVAQGARQNAQLALRRGRRNGASIPPRKDTTWLTCDATAALRTQWHSEAASTGGLFAFEYTASIKIAETRMGRTGR
jgi:hypothetical protein